MHSLRSTCREGRCVVAGSLTTLTDLRDLIAVKLGEISGLTVYKNSAKTLDSLPAVEMLLPEIQRVDVDSPESALGLVDWKTAWPLRLSTSADEVDVAGDTMLQMAALMIAKFDANDSLGTTATTGFTLLCRLVNMRESQPPRPGDAKPTRQYDGVLEVWQMV